MPNTAGTGTGTNAGNGTRGPRVAALVGPYGSGKTALLEAMLAACGAVKQKGRALDGNRVGDSSPEAKARQMTTEVVTAECAFLGDRWTFLDCPGSVELLLDTQSALMCADMAVVVVDPVPDRALMLRPLLKFLADNGVPHMLFINKVDTLDGTGVRLREVMQVLQSVSRRPLVLRQIPIREGDAIRGYVDLISERAYRYKPGQPSDLIPMPEDARERESEARQALLETLADFDDGLMAQLLEDSVPDKTELYRHLAEDIRKDRIVPVLIGSAERDHGIQRLWKALRHDAPGAAETAARMALDLDGTQTAVQVFRTVHAPHTGKMSIARVWKGMVTDGMTLAGQRVSGLWRVHGHETAKVPRAETGEVVALGRMEELKTGMVATDKAMMPPVAWPVPPQPVFHLAVRAENRNDEVKLSGALQKLAEEDPAFAASFQPDTGELLLSGQGDIHLQLAVERLRSRHNLAVKGVPPRVPYKETIRKGVSHHARFKRQTGGHGQFADVTIEVRPLPRGSGFQFNDRIVGGVVPRQFIPAVEAGVREALVQGPLGFPVVDVAVTLVNGQFHAVDSSEQAFKTAGRMAMSEALPKCEPVLLEPILEVAIQVPTEHTAKVQRLVSGRRGQILGFDGRPGWDGWDEVRAHIPQSEVQDLIVELRSLTQGVGTFSTRFDHLAELVGRLADKVVGQRQAIPA
ncbi:MAG TPA: elongation factor G [Azospirillaceae bacterium]|nr:elongation factor G [Azospirillaceae bacterium]